MCNRRRFLHSSFQVACLALLAAYATGADEPRAARSVHLWYKAPAAVTFYNEVTVEQSVPASYFCVCGFNHGYFGIQELGDGRKVVIFSVWDPAKGDNPGAVPEEERVKVLHSGEGVRIRRFGGEGTGGQSMFDYDWKVGQTCKCMVKVVVDGDRTSYAAYFYIDEEKQWKHVATFQTITGGDLLGGYYSFIEDFRRDGQSARQSRRARFGGGWVKTGDGQWLPLTEATFTADNTPTMNIDAGPADDRFFLQTGGDTANHTPLKSAMKCGQRTATPPEDPAWALVWSDEFDAPGRPDAGKWDYEKGLVRNREKQYYTVDRPENARVEDGMLVIEARKEKYETADYTSAGLRTRGKASWTYGRIEVRAKLPTGRGMWPAIWTLGTERRGGWPACGELDIMENVGFEPDIIHANVHTAKYNHVKGNSKGAKITADAPYEKFHLYAMEWYADRIEFFLDGRRYLTYANENTGPDAWPFDSPQYLILNIAVGGAWGGQKGIDDAIFPQRFLIDYVRVFSERPR